MKFEYNFLNLPQVADSGDTGIENIYDATGRKWQTTSTVDILDQYGSPTGETFTETKLYLNGIEFVGEGTVASRLSSINPSSNGRKAYEAGAVESRIEYYHTDHLGNVRLAFSDLDGDNAITVRDIYYPANEIVQERHYYPFGLTHTGPWFATVAPDNAYRYNGKELDEATGLYDYGARWYDPAIGRFINIDPLAEQFAPWSPYNYGYDNPIRFTDPDGQAAEDCCGGAGTGWGWIGEGFRQYFQAAGQSIDRLQASLSIAKRTEVTKQVDYEDGVTEVSTERYGEQKSTTTASTNFFSLLDPGSYANKSEGGSEYQGPPLLEVSERTTNSVVMKASLKTKVEGADLAVTAQTTHDVSTGETTISGKTLIGIGNNGIFIERSSSKSGTTFGVQAEHKTEGQDKTQTVFSLKLQYTLPDGR